MTDGPMFADRTMKMYAQLGKKYGVDYVNLGFFSGAESGLPEMWSGSA